MRRALLAVLLLLAAAPALAKPPVWDKRVDSAKRFKVLKAFDSEAVLDQETGVVWQRTPVQVPARTWLDAVTLCVNARIAGRGGWRLPTVYEMRSLIDAEGQALTEGHPFVVADGYFWTSTIVPTFTTLAYVGDLGEPAVVLYANGTSATVGTWCVRGGLSAGTEPN
jgi:Protein of unknown function (DUF1566)